MLNNLWNLHSLESKVGVQAVSRRTGRAAAVFCLALVGLPPTLRAGGEPKIGKQVGQMYPDFLLPKVGGGWGRLSDYREKKTILFHFASW